MIVKPYLIHYGGCLTISYMTKIQLCLLNIQQTANNRSFRIKERPVVVAFESIAIENCNCTSFSPHCHPNEPISAKAARPPKSGV